MIPSDQDIYLFHEGKNFQAYKLAGARQTNEDGQTGFRFTVWAPMAKSVSLIGDFNGWNRHSHAMTCSEDSGLWSLFLPEIKSGNNYKFSIVNQAGVTVEKADPFAFSAETPPKTASRTYTSQYTWNDQSWMSNRSKRQGLNQPLSIYELHLGSWKRNNSNEYLSYRELAPLLVEYIQKLGFTHVEFLPVMEHPFYGSWGYQVTSYFAPTSRYGSPDDLRFLIDTLHQANIGVILDWVPSHFPSDEFALARFTGQALYEHADPRLGYHPEWKSLIFNYGKREIQSFLISSALYWLEEFHVDGIRVDAVASMLYLDYSRNPGEWVPNIYGGRENLEAVHFLKELNHAIEHFHPDTFVIAEESTAWPQVTGDLKDGGLGFQMKWDMGWMHDTLKYFQKESIHRKFHQGDLVFRMVYAFNERFVLPISHDEVVYGKGSLYNKMTGDEWQKHANLRVFLAYMFALPGKKLLFMGSEWGAESEWNHEGQLNWQQAEWPQKRGISCLVQDLNQHFKSEKAFHELDFESRGFAWIDFKDHEQSVLTFIRRDSAGSEILIVLNLTPLPRYNYKIGVPESKTWKEILNTDSQYYGGSGIGNLGSVLSKPNPKDQFPCTLELTLPPLAAIYLKKEAINV